MPHQINTLAFRMPNCDDILRLIEETKTPIACTSANISGETPVNSIEDVNENVVKQVDFLYTKKLQDKINIKPSKIILCTGKFPKILR